jgi:non-ribosomal peptide synthetase component F
MTARLEQFLIKHRVSLGIFAQGLWVALLGQYLQRDRVPYGMVTTGRSAPLAGIEHMSGHSINIVPVLVPLSKEKQFLDHLKDILDIQVEWTRYEYTQIDKIYEWLDRPVDRPLIDHYVVIQNLGSAMGEIRGMEKDAERWERDAELMFAKMEYPMRFDVFSGYEYCFTFQYYLRYYTTPAVKGLMDNLKIMIEAAIENPAQTVGELMKLVDSERYKYHENEEPDHFVQH